MRFTPRFYKIIICFLTALLVGVSAALIGVSAELRELEAYAPDVAVPTAVAGANSAPLTTAPAYAVTTTSAIFTAEPVQNDEFCYDVLSESQINAVLAGNVYPNDAYRRLAEACVSLVGQVRYFWGGKSTACGWDARWGVPTTVGPGSDTSGTVRPFGLDCSGFVSWAFIQTGLSPSDVSGYIGDGTRKQWSCSSAIKWEELRVGDLVFMNEYPHAAENHVAICVGHYNGEPVFAHCSYSENNVVVTTAGNLFRYARRQWSFADLSNGFME